MATTSRCRSPRALSPRSLHFCTIGSTGQASQHPVLALPSIVTTLHISAHMTSAFCNVFFFVLCLLHILHTATCNCRQLAFFSPLRFAFGPSFVRWPSVCTTRFQAIGDRDSVQHRLNSLPPHNCTLHLHCSHQSPNRTAIILHAPPTTKLVSTSENWHHKNTPSRVPVCVFWGRCVLFMPLASFAANQMQH